MEESLAPVGSVRRGVILLFRRSTRLPLVLTQPVSLEFLNKRPLGWTSHTNPTVKYSLGLGKVWIRKIQRAT